MSGVILTPDTPETRYALQKKARLDMIVRVLEDILMDMKICDLEGWDRMEYINMLKGVINGLGRSQ